MFVYEPHPLTEEEFSSMYNDEHRIYINPVVDRPVKRHVFAELMFICLLYTFFVYILYVYVEKHN